MSDLKALLARERRHADQARKHVQAGSEVLEKLFEDRAAIGAECDKERAKAETAGADWADWCKAHLPFSRQQADKYRRVYHARAYVRENNLIPELPVNMDDVVRLLPTQADAKKLAYAGAGESKRDSDAWMTPAEYIESARTVMGSIDFDPFSSHEANEQLVRAEEIYTEEEDAFLTPWPVDWANTVWMNPPYGRGKIAKAVDALLAHLDRIEQAVVLVNNATDAAWFHKLARKSAAFVWTSGRISFLTPGDKLISSNTRGQFFFYFGERETEFCAEFGKYGFCVTQHGGYRHG